MNHSSGILRTTISVFLVGLGCLAGLGCGGDGTTGGGNGNGASGGTGPGGSGPGGGGGGATPGTGGLFEAAEPWTKDVSDLQPDARSDDIIAALDSAGGWGADGTMQITFGI